MKNRRPPIFFGGKRNMKYPIGLKPIARLFYKLLSLVSNIEIDVLRPTFSSWLIKLNVIIQRAGPPVRHPSRRLRAIPRENLLRQIDEGAQARSHVAASWVIEAISGIRGRPLV
jgi:hypothetical protein